MTATVDNDNQMAGKRPLASQRRILVVEDEVLIAMDLKGRLESSGYEVPGIAACADSALSLAGCLNPDLILMDIRLKGGSDGIKAATEVRQQMDIPVIFLTSHSDAETLERARLSEPFGYVVKPFGSVNFRALIDVALQKHEAERSLRKSVQWYSTLEKRRLMRLFNGDMFDDSGIPADNMPAIRQNRPESEKISAEDVPAAIAGVNQEGRIVFLNSRAAALFGYERKELLGESIEILVPASCRELIFRSGAERSGESGSEKEIEVECVRKDSGNFRAEITLGSLQTEEGCLLVACFREIAARNRTEAERDQLAAIVDSSDSAIISVTLDGVITTWNRGAERLYGYSAAEMVGKAASVLLPSDRIEEGTAALDTVRSGGRIQRDTVRRTKNGRLIDVAQTASLIQDAKGRPAGVSVVSTDISQHVRTEARFRALLECSPDALAAINRKGRIVLVNGRLEKLVGYTREELLEQSIEILLPQRFRGHPEFQVSFEKIPESLSLGEGVQLCGVRKNGEEFPIEINLGPLETREGIFILMTIRDLTERRRGEEKIRRSLREKDVMLNEIHHRVKNNLQVVSSLLNLQADQIRDPVARLIFADSQNRIQSMALIHQQLYMSNNFAEIDFASYLRSLANHVLASSASNAESFHIALDTAGASLNLANAIPCGLIVNELISNSLKHSFQGRSSGEIRVGFSTGEGICTLTVDDDGSPLPPDIGANRPPTMGLRLVEALTSQLGGNLEIGNGPKFRITFSDRHESAS